ncbi:MAG: polysaccharide deacetylase family protein [Clostridia bacterium]|nr:polysaccharide deacetylase family protein [Clostridia bacterium]
MRRAVSLSVAIILTLVVLTSSVSADDGYGHVYCKSTQGQKRVALTFDDGPHPRYTAQILSILEEYGVTATFFIIGVNAENYPESLRMIAESGCEIGNHTYSHVRIDRMSGDAIEEEILRCEQVIYSMTGKRPTLFRPPEGRIPKNLLSISTKLDYNVVLWSIDTLDWSHNPSDKICSAVIDNLNGGDIILMHDYVSGKNTTCDALRVFIPKLLSMGYEFVTVSELIG